jgi:hypothetical protein
MRSRPPLAALALLAAVALAAGCDPGARDRARLAREEAEAARAELEKARARAEAAEARQARLKAELERAGRPRLLAIQVRGSFTSVPGETGSQGFGQKFVSPPNVTWEDPDGGAREVRAATVIVEVTRECFRWKNTAGKEAKGGRLHWRASGRGER